MIILNRKVFRELARMRGQVIAITLVMACGIMVYVSSRHTYIALLETQESYYTSYRFADVFAGIKRAPAPVAERIARIPGVSSVRTRIVMDVNLDVPGLDEPATGRLVSIPEVRRPVLNDIAIQEGRYPAIGRPEEVIISEAFALANGLAPDDWIGAVINGRRKALRVVGIGLSPEYVYEVQGSGSIFPDNLRFGVIWMSRDALGAAFDMEGGFNDLAVALSPEARERDVIDRMDLILEPYGSAGAYGRGSQISHKFLSDEILGLSVSSNVTPAIFLGIAAILLHIVFSRMVRAQRDQIAIMKAFGYRNLSIGWHYLKFAFLAVSGGTLLGIVGGFWIGRPLTGMYQAYYRFPNLVYELHVDVITLSAVISVSAALFGTLHALRAAMALPPAEAMRPESPPHFRPLALERLGLHRMLAPAWRMIFRNMERKPARTMLSAFGIAMAVAILVMGRFTFDSIDYMIDYQFRTVQRDDAAVVFAGPRPASARFELSRLPGVVRSEPYRAVPVRLRSGHLMKQTAITGLDPAGELRQLFDREGRVQALPPEGIVLNKTLADLLAVRAGDMLAVEVHGRIENAGQPAGFPDRRRADRHHRVHGFPRAEPVPGRRPDHLRRLSLRGPASGGRVVQHVEGDAGRGGGRRPRGRDQGLRRIHRRKHERHHVHADHLRVHHRLRHGVQRRPHRPGGTKPRDGQPAGARVHRAGDFRRPAGRTGRHHAPLDTDWLSDRMEFMLSCRGRHRPGTLQDAAGHHRKDLRVRIPDRYRGGRGVRVHRP